MYETKLTKHNYVGGHEGSPEDHLIGLRVTTQVSLTYVVSLCAIWLYSGFPLWPNSGNKIDGSMKGSTDILSWKSSSQWWSDNVFRWCNGNDKTSVCALKWQGLLRSKCEAEVSHWMEKVIVKLYISERTNA